MHVFPAKSLCIFEQLADRAAVHEELLWDATTQHTPAEARPPQTLKSLLLLLLLLLLLKHTA